MNTACGLDASGTVVTFSDEGNEQVGPTKSKSGGASVHEVKGSLLKKRASAVSSSQHLQIRLQSTHANNRPDTRPRSVLAGSDRFYVWPTNGHYRHVSHLMTLCP